MSKTTQTTTSPPADLIDDEEMLARLHLETPRQLAELRRKRIIPFVRLSRKRFRYNWLHVVEALSRLEVRAIGDKK